MTVSKKYKAYLSEITGSRVKALKALSEVMECSPVQASRYFKDVASGILGKMDCEMFTELIFTEEEIEELKSKLDGHARLTVLNASGHTLTFGNFGYPSFPIPGYPTAVA